jgi:hypothetical protein
MKQRNKEKHILGPHFIDWWLGNLGYGQQDREAIQRGMSVSSFKGEMPRDKNENDKLITSWLDAGRLQ